MNKSAAGHLTFLLRPESFAVHRLAPDAAFDPAVMTTAGWWSVTRTGSELSIIAPVAVNPGAGAREEGWSCLGIDGQLDFAMIGVMAEVARLLAEAGVSILAISTFDTDYFLVRTVQVQEAIRALEQAGHQVRRL